MVKNIQQQEMASLFCDMNYVVSTSVEELDNNNKQFYQHVHKNLLIKKKKTLFVTFTYDEFVVSESRNVIVWRI